MDQIDFFFSIFRFTPIWLLIDFILIIHFIIAWFYNYLKSGWKIDLWFFSLFMSFFIPVFLIYPFSASIGNLPATGVHNYYKILSFIDIAFKITLLGYLCIWIGRILYNLIGNTFLIKQLFKTCFGWLESIVRINTSDKVTINSFSIFTLILLITLFTFQLLTNNLLNPRDFFMKNPIIRPIYLIIITIYPTAFAYQSLKYFQYKDRKDIILLFLLFIFSLFLGTRSATVSVLLSVYISYLYINYKKVKLFKILFIGIFFLFSVLYLSQLRSGRVNPLDTLIRLSDIFYGNNFSDIRDFAWILSYWDGNYVLGQTYLAGILSFIPRAISDYRSQWAISVYTDKMVGFDPNEHPGLRPGMFGESYLNFGLVGVIVLGIIYGFILRYSDVSLKKYIEKNDIFTANSKVIPFWFISFFTITAGFWGFYVSLLINLGLFTFIIVKYIILKYYNKLIKNNN